MEVLGVIYAPPVSMEPRGFQGRYLETKILKRISIGYTAHDSLLPARLKGRGKRPYQNMEVLCVIWFQVFRVAAGEYLRCNHVLPTNTAQNSQISLGEHRFICSLAANIQVRDITIILLCGVLTVCGEGPCCTEAMQKQLSYQSKRQFDAGLRSELDTLANVLLSRAIKFDAIIVAIIPSRSGAIERPRVRANFSTLTG
ncbi:unnamed protein product [Nesidiocoris tenuis]|uniref:Uncharacterized protein n=1 Tax=Nesidiocoris tenuis TaxID=355587 RepID=A0A6H5H168_9HEMI|nr:unnamed protein product [Nesidiocoris tenuis]